MRRQGICGKVATFLVQLSDGNRLIGLQQQRTLANINERDDHRLRRGIGPEVRMPRAQHSFFGYTLGTQFLSVRAETPTMSGAQERSSALVGHRA